MNDNTRIELEALITEREGMVAENQRRMSFNDAQAYSEGAFFELADKMRVLVIPAFIVPEGALEKPLDSKPGKIIAVGDGVKSSFELTDTFFLQCSICGQPSGVQGQRAGDICGRMEGIPSDDKNCPGVLRKG